MLTQERRQHIMQLLRERGKVTVKELSQMFSTSEVTIRNDLKDLDARGLIHRAYGGALVPESAIMESSLQERFQAHADEKRRIGIAAAALVKDGETIILDSGTTTQEIARAIKGRQNIRVITNGVNVAMELLGIKGIQLVILGGILRDDSVSVVGRYAEDMLKEFSADKVFVGAAGVDTEFGLSTPNTEEAQVDQAMVRIARERILVADSSKFGKRALSRIVPLSQIHTVITDSGLPENLAADIRALGVELTVV